MSLTDKMSFNEFIVAVENTVRERVDNKVEIREVQKNNGTKLHGLVITNEDVNYCPTLYLEKYYKMYLNNDFENTVQCILDDYNNNNCIEEIDFSIIKKREYVVSRIKMRLINYEKNEEMLKNMPHRKFLDLAIIYELNLDIDKLGKGSIIINDGLYKFWDLSEEDLYNIALENTKGDFELKNVIELMTEFFGADDMPDDIDMEVLTNRNRTFGAAVIIHEEVLKYVYNKLKVKKLILIPSSVHEFIIIPYRIKDDIEKFNEMLRSINENELEPEEILSDHVYLYDGSELISC